MSPFKEIRVKQNIEPWMTNEILNLIKEIIFLNNTNSFLDLKITNSFVKKGIKFKERSTEQDLIIFQTKLKKIK